MGELRDSNEREYKRAQGRAGELNFVIMTYSNGPSTICLFPAKKLLKSLFIWQGMLQKSIGML